MDKSESLNYDALAQVTIEWLYGEDNMLNHKYQKKMNHYMIIIIEALKWIIENNINIWVTEIYLSI